MSGPVVEYVDYDPNYPGRFAQALRRALAVTNSPADRHRPGLPVKESDPPLRIVVVAGGPELLRGLSLARPQD
jgi:hypothetical protein